MPVDVSADVIANTPLSHDYNVVALSAPEIAATALPGQFVMVKAGGNLDPLLRRPFSVFEILRDRDGRPTGISLLNKRIGPSTALLYQARPGDRIACLGPLGRPWRTPGGHPPDATAYLVAGGVGLAAFATLAESFAADGVRQVLFYGARTGGELFHLDFFLRSGVEAVLTTEDGSTGERGRVTLPLERRLAARADPHPIVYACGPEAMMAAAATVARRHRAPCYVSLERVMGCGLGGCYSCVVPVVGDDGRPHHVRTCLAGPVMNAEQIVWN
jgi:dihydroorotate dehydrogenase electron transfer subunit